jgi:hypothetical protein
MSVAKGSHCQATIRQIATRGASANQSIGCSPTDFASHANRPDTGCISRFFQISALTVGITKNGAMTMRRTMPCPKIGWSSSRARSVPPTTVITSTPPTSFSVLMSALKNAGSVRKYS